MYRSCRSSWTDCSSSSNDDNSSSAREQCPLRLVNQSPSHTTHRRRLQASWSAGLRSCDNSGQYPTPVRSQLRHLINLNRLLSSTHLHVAHRLRVSMIVDHRLPHHLRNQQLRIKLLIQFLNPRREIHHVANHRVLASQRRSNTASYRLS